MSRFLTRLVAALVVALTLGACLVMCARVAERGRYATAYSTYSAGPQGTRAVYELARRAGYPTQRWVEDLARLPERGVLIALGGCRTEQRRPLSPYEQESLLGWVQRGGTLMVFGAESYVPDAYPAHLESVPGQCRQETLGELVDAFVANEVPSEGVDVPADEPVGEPAGPSDSGRDENADSAERPPDSQDELAPWQATWSSEEPVFIAGTADGPLAELQGVPMIQPSRVIVASGRSPTRLAHFGERVGAVHLAEGEGSIVLFASGSMMVNQSILAQRGGVLLTRLLTAYARPGAPVLFDEYHLGTGATRSLVRYLRQAGAGVVLLQLLVLFAIFVRRSGRRLGELEEPATEAPGGTASYVAATSALYSRSTDRVGIGRVMLVRALERIAAHHRIRAREPQGLVNELRELRRHQAADAAASLVELFSEPVDGEKGLVALAGRVDALLQGANAPHSLEPVTARDAHKASLAPHPELPTS